MVWKLTKNADLNQPHFYKRGDETVYEWVSILFLDWNQVTNLSRDHRLGALTSTEMHVAIISGFYYLFKEETTYC